MSQLKGGDNVDNCKDMDVSLKNMMSMINANPKEGAAGCMRGCQGDHECGPGLMCRLQ